MAQSYPWSFPSANPMGNAKNRGYRPTAFQQYKDVYDWMDSKQKERLSYFGLGANNPQAANGTAFGHTNWGGQGFTPTQITQPGAFQDPYKNYQMDPSVDPTKAINSAMPGINEQKDKSFADAAAKFGAAGGGFANTPYAASLGTVSRKASNDIANLTENMLYDSSKFKANLKAQMDQAEAERALTSWGKSGDWSMQGQEFTGNQAYNAWDSSQGRDYGAWGQTNEWDRADKQRGLDERWKLYGASGGSGGPGGGGNDIMSLVNASYNDPYAEDYETGQKYMDQQNRDQTRQNLYNDRQDKITAQQQQNSQWDANANANGARDYGGYGSANEQRHNDPNSVWGQADYMNGVADKTRATNNASFEQNYGGTLENLKGQNALYNDNRQKQADSRKDNIYSQLQELMKGYGNTQGNSQQKTQQIMMLLMSMLGGGG